MQNKTMVELLELMLKNQGLFHSGLCYWAQRLESANIISRDERYRLEDYIAENKPFFIVRWWHGDYFWKPMSIEPRVKWIKKHIKKLKQCQ